MKFLYIHGLNSTGESSSGGKLLKRAIPELMTPTMPDNPVDWADTLEPIVAELSGQKIIIVGVSTGGFFAAWLSKKYGHSCVLINPVIDHRAFFDFVGENMNYETLEKWDFSANDVLALHQYDVGENMVPTLVLLGEKDDVLDYKKTLNKYRNCAEVVVTNNDHRYKLTQEEVKKIKDTEFTLLLA